MKHNKTPKGIMDEMVEFFRTHSAKETEMRFNVSQGIPQYYHIKKYGYKKPQEKRRLTEKESKEVAEFASNNTLVSTMQKYNINRKSVLFHYGKHNKELHPCMAESIMLSKQRNSERVNGEVKRFYALTIGEWFTYCNQLYRVGAKTKTHFICNRFDQSKKIFNGKISFGVNNQMRVQTQILT